MGSNGTGGRPAVDRMSMDNPLDTLTRQLARLPGVGRKSAERMAIACVRRPDDLVDGLIRSLDEVRRQVRCCSLCGSITTVGADPCRLCTDPARDATRLCVVEETADIAALERSGGYRGRYHALLGRISPMQETGPSDLRVASLLQRVASDAVEEVILALSTSMEGDATAAYLTARLKSAGVHVTRLAMGIPAGSGVGYSDPVTLARAMDGRQEA